MVDLLGPKEAYTRIHSVLNKIEKPFGLSLENIPVVSPLHPLIQTIRTVIQTGEGISGIRFSRNALGNAFIEDAYIYRLQ